MSQQIEINPGEIKVKFKTPTKGKVSFLDLGINPEDLTVNGGNLRVVFELEGIGEHQYYHVPTIEISYEQEMEAIHWQCEFNNEVILDTIDHHGHSSVMLLNRNKLSELEQHHENTLIVHGDFPQEAKIIAENSYINFFK